jgi:SseB protein N-terminal domain
VTDWEPATEAETAMRDALRAADQELYFRILARTELLLPVSPEALAGRAPMGWGTWNSGGRTHVLAFTSAESMRACLAEHAGSARRIAYHELAGAWPNHEWWLAVNPGLPIEGYLPPWFVTQLARGDVRMPGRTTGVRSRAYATAPADSSAHDIGVEQTYQPFGGRTQSPFPRGAGAAAATGARREAARATATAARDAFTPTPPPPPDEPIEAEMLDTDSVSVRSAGAHSAGRSVTASGRPDGPSRRPRRHDATIIDAEIIESTVLGMTALDAMVVNATVIDASTFDSDIIDATLIELSVEDTGARATRMRRTGTQAGLTAAPSAGAYEPSGADRTRRSEDPASRRVDPVAAAHDASPTRPINLRHTPPADATQRIDPRAAEAARAASETARAARAASDAAPDATQRIDPQAAAAARAAAQAARGPAADATQRIDARNRPETRPADATQRIDPAAAEAARAAARAAHGAAADATPRAAADASPTRPIRVHTDSTPPPDATQRIDPQAAEAARAAAAARIAEAAARAPASDATQRIDLDADPSPTRRIDIPRRGAPSSGSGTDSPTSTSPWGGEQRPTKSAGADDGVGADSSMWPDDDAAPDESVAAASSAAPTSAAGATAAAHAATVDAADGADDATTIVTAADVRAAQAATAAAGTGPTRWAEDAADATTVATPGAAADAPVADALAAAATPDSDSAATGASSERTGESDVAATAAEPDAAAGFVPANETESVLLAAATSGETEQFLSTLLLAKVLVPIPADASPDSQLDDEAFPWRREEVDGQQYLVVFTSAERMSEFLGDDAVAITAKFIHLIHVWPELKWAFAVNPGSPVGAMLPGIQIKALAAWADDVGLTDDEEFGEYDDTRVTPPAPVPVVMQKPIAAAQVDYYLDRGYDRASGFVHRATEIMHLHTPAALIASLGLTYSGSPFRRDAAEIYLLRWSAFRPDLYRIPYGGQHEAAMRAMQGWIIERAPFRGNGFAPAEDGQVIAEFKVDSIRLPHGAQMWRLTSDGRKTLIALLDADECLWRPARGVDSEAVWDPSVPVIPPTPSVEAAKPATGPTNGAPSADPSDDPLDPRWRGSGRRGTNRSAGTDTGTRTGRAARSGER